MFSRCMIKPGPFQQLVNNPALQKRANLYFIRCASNNLPVTSPDSIPADETDIQKAVRHWDASNAVFYGPDRDLKNFPPSKQPQQSPAVRIGIFPDSLFTALYDKTGVTGPYLFGTGMLITLLSKELWVVEHGFSEFLTFWICAVILVKKLGPGITDYLSRETKRLNDSRWFKPLEEAHGLYQGNIDTMETQIEQYGAAKSIFEAKRENIAFQLEAEYRKRLSEVHYKIKRRLDYQVEMEAARKRYEHHHLVEWVVDHVIKGITPQQEKEAMNKCITDLKGLAPA